MDGHIGIAACSAEGAALCYRTICQAHAAGAETYAHPTVSLHSISFARYMAAIEAGDWAEVGEIMLRSAEALARSGADFVICPDNTIHQALPLMRERSPLPWLHIAEIVADEALRRGFRRIGITGTAWLVAGEVYPQALASRGLAFVRPSEADRETVNRIIMNELVRGVFDPGSTERLRAVVARLTDAGCDAVVLGCTELPLVLDDANSPLPTLDSTRLLARAACERAGSGAPARS